MPRMSHLLFVVQFEALTGVVRQLVQLGVPDHVLNTVTVSRPSSADLDKLLSVAATELGCASARNPGRSLTNLKVLDLTATTIHSEGVRREPAYRIDEPDRYPLVRLGGTWGRQIRPLSPSPDHRHRGSGQANNEALRVDRLAMRSNKHCRALRHPALFGSETSASRWHTHSWVIGRA